MEKQTTFIRLYTVSPDTLTCNGHRAVLWVWASPSCQLPACKDCTLSGLGGSQGRGGRREEDWSPITTLVINQWCVQAAHSIPMLCAQCVCLQGVGHRQWWGDISPHWLVHLPSITLDTGHWTHTSTTYPTYLSSNCNNNLVRFRIITCSLVELSVL